MLLRVHGPIHRSRAGPPGPVYPERRCRPSWPSDSRQNWSARFDDEPGATQVRQGRPGDVLALNLGGQVAVGMDCSVHRVHVVVADLGHTVLAEGEAPLDLDQSWVSILDTGIAAMDDVLRRAGATRASVVGIGLGVPGPVDVRSGRVGLSSNLSWSGAQPADELGARLETPVLVDNNAHLGALAELMWGAGIGCQDLFYLLLSTGIGSGVIVNGHLVRGAAGAAGEVGHMTLDDSGPTCRCGNRGCLEAYAGVPAILAALRPVLGEDITLDQVLDASMSGNRAAQRVIGDAGRVVGRALGAVSNLLNPERIVIGGDLALAGDVLLEHAAGIQ